MSFLSTQNDRGPTQHDPHRPKMLYPHKSLRQCCCKDECPHIIARAGQAIGWEREAGNTEGHSEIPGKAASVDQNNTVTMKSAHTASLHPSIHSASHTSKAAWLRGAGGECAWAGELQAWCPVARAIIKGSAKPQSVRLPTHRLASLLCLALLVTLVCLQRLGTGPSKSPW